MGRSEKSILNETLVAVSALPETLVYRNNTGSAWQGRRLRTYPGQMIEVEQGMVVLCDARPIDFGLTGSGDIMGTHKGRALAIETKTLTGSQRQSQINFQRAWQAAGGVYFMVRSAQEAVKMLSDT